MNNKKTIIFKYIMGTVDLVVGVIILSAVSDMKDDWTYYFDSTKQNLHQFGNVFGWFFICCGFASLIEASIHQSLSRKKAQNNIPTGFDAFCAYCGQPIRCIDSICPHCSQNVSQSTQNDNDGLIQGHTDTYNFTECIFCGKAIDSNDSICPHCRRRQD